MFKFMEKIINKFRKPVIKDGSSEDGSSEDGRFVNEFTKNAIIEYQIKKFKRSKIYQNMVCAMNYYKGEHDILKKKRLVIGDNGELIEVTNLENNKVIDNQYKKLIDQKTNYLFGKPLTFQSENKNYVKEIQTICNKRFFKTFNHLGRDALTYGIGWLYVYYDEKGEFSIKRFNPLEIYPIWKDDEHTELDYAIRIYEVTIFDGMIEKTIEKIEVYDQTGISFFSYEHFLLKPCEPFNQNYLSIGEESFNWDFIPLIPFKFNEEIPLIINVKSLQDGINTIISNFQDAMAENTRNTILVLVNYDGENLGEFRRNLATYGAVKVRSEQGENGDVKSLQVEINSENYKVILDVFKKAIIENGRGFDAKDDKVSGNANQMNIQSMYSDVDLDANSLEIEFSSSLEILFDYICIHLKNSGKGDFLNENIEFKFNRDVLINTSQLIEDIQNSVGIVSDETLIAKHPFVINFDEELKRISKQKESEENPYFNVGGDDSAK